MKCNLIELSELPSRALVIKKEWLDLILRGHKKIELRSNLTKIRGRIAIIESGSGLVVGEVVLDGCTLETEEWVKENEELHKVYPNRSFPFSKYRWCWWLKSAKRYFHPVEYKHPQGAVIWVNLDNVEKKILR